MQKESEHKFQLVSKFKPAGSQPEAIKSLTDGVRNEKSPQTLLGVTGSGKSLDYSEQIIVRDSLGKLQKYLIGDFVEQYIPNDKKVSNESIALDVDGYKVLSFDPISKNISECNIKQVSRHKEEHVYVILLDDYSQIKVTKDHNCFKLVDANFELCSTADLKVGDYLPTSNVFYDDCAGLKFINLLEYTSSARITIDLLVKKYGLDDALLLRVLKNKRHSPKWKLNQIIYLEAFFTGLFTLHSFWGLPFW